MEDAYFAECNTSTPKLYGMDTPSDLIGKSFSEIIIDEESRIETAEEFITAGYKLLSHHTSHGDEGLRYFTTNIIGIIEDDKLMRIWGMRREITEDETQRIALIESEQRFRLIIAWSLTDSVTSSEPLFTFN